MYAGIATLRKHAYSIILKNFTTQNWKFTDKKSDIFIFLLKNMDCGYSLEPPRQT